MSDLTVGLTLIISGLALRYWAFIHLYRAGLTLEHIARVQPPPSWTYDGPYRYMRHPAYVGSMMVLVGAGWWALGPGGSVIALPAVPYFFERIVRENRIRDLEHQ